MKIKITAKCPDCVGDAVDRAVEDWEASKEYDKEDLSSSEMMSDDRRDFRDKIEAAVYKWVEYGEYITIEVDTETGEARVCPK